jgi:hypothetical protein
MDVISELKIGDPAPDAVVFDGNGQTIHLREMWAGKPTLLCFLRYFG